MKLRHRALFYLKAKGGEAQFMNERNMSIVFSSGIDKITECNSSFDSGVLRVCYTGKNRNNSFISKETFEQCMKSIYNCPIVCNYDRESGTIGSHDVELVTDADGSMRIVKITQPVGVVPESANYWWEEIEDTSGVHEYLCVDVLLWKRQEAYRKIKSDGITEESMEISIKEGEMVDGVYVIKRFEFTAFCLLGSDRPCFEAAALEVFALDGFKSQLAEMMKEAKETFSMAQPSKEEVVYTQNYSEGGEKVLDEKTALMKEFGLTEEALDFKLGDFTVEELRVKFEEMTAHQEGDEPKKDFALAEQFREDLGNALGTEMIETCFGPMRRYWYVDYDSEAMEVYCRDAADDWKLFGFSYSMNGDNIVIDFDGKKRKKFAIVDFDEGEPAEQDTVFSNVFGTVSAKYSENDTQWMEKYQTATGTISSMESELNELRQFKACTESAIAQSERENVFAQFGDLAGIEAFESLRSDSAMYTVDELEEKCYAIRGRNGAAANFSIERKAPKLPVEMKGEPKELEPYGGVFAEYGFKAAK